MIVRLVIGKVFRLDFREDVRVLSILLRDNILERPFGFTLARFLGQFGRVSVASGTPQSFGWVLEDFRLLPSSTLGLGRRDMRDFFFGVRY
jgi:hypothetical protein